MKNFLNNFLFFVSVVNRISGLWLGFMSLFSFFCIEGEYGVIVGVILVIIGVFLL